MYCGCLQPNSYKTQLGEIVPYTINLVDMPAKALFGITCQSNKTQPFV